jgi:hypothetical protein
MCTFFDIFGVKKLVFCFEKKHLCVKNNSNSAQKYPRMFLNILTLSLRVLKPHNVLILYTFFKRCGMDGKQSLK